MPDTDDMLKINLIEGIEEDLFEINNLNFIQF